MQTDIGALAGRSAGLRGLRILMAVGCLLCWSTCLHTENPMYPAEVPESSSVRVTGPRNWYVMPDDVVDSLCVLTASVSDVSRNIRMVDCWIDSIYQGRFPAESVTVDLSRLRPDSHTVTFAFVGDTLGFFRDTLIVSYPVYVTVSNDWDRPQDSIRFEPNLSRSVEFRRGKPHLVMTHFAGPYAFTDTAISDERKTWMAKWLIRMRDDYGDEIGLHIHPYCSFMEAAGIACIVDSSYFDAKPDVSGYTISCGRYSEKAFTRALCAADSIFMDRGLGKPVSFRAGGWTADIETMHALQNAGYAVDASGFNQSRGEELAAYPLFDQLAAVWAAIDDTSQPYYPSMSRIDTSAAPLFSVLEAPDNGILIDYIDVDEMIEVFHSNWPGGPSRTARHYSIGYHPDSFYRFEILRSRLTGIIEYLDSFLAAYDAGPVVYVRMKDLPRIWSRKP
jgi:hypothetical protein